MKYLLILASLAIFCGCTATVRDDVNQDARTVGDVVQKHSRLVTTNPEKDDLGSTIR